MDLDELIVAVDTIYQNTVHPIVLTDELLNIKWANKEALRRFPTLALENGVREIIRDYDYGDIMSSLKAGRPFVAHFAAEPLSVMTADFIPVLDGAKIVGCQVLLGRYGESASVPVSSEPEKIIADFSHEYKMPLTIVFSTLGLMARNIDALGDKRLEQYLKLATQNCYRLLRLFNNVTEVSKYRSGINKMDLKNGDLCVFLSEVCQAASVLTTASGVPLTWSVPEEPVITAFDRAKLSSAFFNLISNSCRYCKDGNAIRVKLECQGDKAVVTVTDRGGGISGDTIDRIFEPYFSDSQRGEFSCGAGLGLSIVKNVIVAHGGTIAVRSEPGMGTTMAFTLPVKTDDKLSNYLAENSEDYLTDRFSTLYIELSDVCGCPLL